MSAREDAAGARAHHGRTRVLMVLGRFPEHVGTQVATEIRALAPDHDLRVVALDPPEAPCEAAHPFERVPVEDVRRLLAIVDEFRPHVLHTHSLRYARFVEWLARRRSIPYTVRTDGSDVVVGPAAPWASRVAVESVDALNGEHCLGVLVLPFARPILAQAGVREERLVACWPVLDYARFHDESANDAGVLGVGAATPSRRLTDFVDLAGAMAGPRFDLYCAGRDAPLLARYARERGAPVAVRVPLAHRDMPGAYKRHAWLVHTASPASGGCAWPVSVAEAQAAGLGVCVPAVHPFVADQLGGAGFVYRDLGEAAAILRGGYPAEMRARGFEHARRSDVADHLRLLTDRWGRRGA